MKKIKVLLTLLLGLVILPFVNGCSSNSEMKSDITYATKLSEDYEGKSFIHDGIGEVKFSKSIDGDTSIFKEGNNIIKVRYFGINTPESTAKIEPWGRAASSFTKEHLVNAEKIVLQRDPSSEQFDSAGSRYLGLVWIKDSSSPDFYCLNLLLVEHAFTNNQINDPRSPYLKSFSDAEAYAKKTGRRVHGEEDKSIDTSGKISEVTVSELLADFEKYNNGGDLHIRGIVTNVSGDNFYVSDKGDNKENNSIYAFAGFSTGLGSILKRGHEIDFYCKAGMYNDVPQLTNIYTSKHGDKPFQVISKGNEVKPTVLTGNEDFERMLGSLVEADLEIVKVAPLEDRNHDFTIICKFVGNEDIHLDIRCTQKHNTYFEELFVVGNKVKVRGAMDRFEPDGSNKIYYQVKMGNVDAKNKSDLTLIG